MHYSLLVIPTMPPNSFLVSENGPGPISITQRWKIPREDSTSKEKIFHQSEALQQNWKSCSFAWWRSCFTSLLFSKYLNLRFFVSWDTSRQWLSLAVWVWGAKSHNIDSRFSERFNFKRNFSSGTSSTSENLLFGDINKGG